MPDSEMVQDMFLFSPASTAATAEERILPNAPIVEHEEAFAEMYRTCGPLVHGIVLARVPYDDVNDVVQEVFLAAYKNLHTLRDKTAFGAWIARIARNHAAQYYRNAKPTEELSDELRFQHTPVAEANEILSVIRTLPETYIETLVLRLLEGMTGNEIAMRTGLTPESVRVNLHRGMELLRQKLGIVGVRK